MVKTTIENKHHSMEALLYLPVAVLSRKLQCNIVDKSACTTFKIRKRRPDILDVAY
jgi:hypothetical protein